MDTVDLTILAEHAESKALHKFVADLQRLKDLPTAAIDIVPRSDTAFEVKISYPLAVFDRSVGQFLAVLFGEIPFMRAFGQARFEDLTLPPDLRLVPRASIWFSRCTGAIRRDLNRRFLWPS